MSNRQFWKLEEQFDQGLFDPWISDTIEKTVSLKFIGEAVEAFLETRSNLSPYSIAKYKSVLGQFLRYLGPEYPLVAIIHRHISAFLESPTRRAVTKRTYFTTLTPLLNWLVKTGNLRENPAKHVRLQQVPRKIPRAFTMEQIKQIIEAIKSELHTNRHAIPNTSLWLIPIVRANSLLGLRAGELVNLTWPDVDLESRLLKIRNTDDFQTKNRRDRTIPICQEALRIIADLERCTEYVFPSYRSRQLHRQYLSRRFKHFVRKAGLDERYNFHSLRHNAISWLVSNGASLEAARLYAGHSSVRVTEVNGHLLPKDYQRQIDEAFTLS